MLKKRLAFATADTTPETVYTNTSGFTTVAETLTIAQPSTALATVIRCSIGTDGATTRVFEYSVPAGTQFLTFYPGWVITGTEVLQLSSVSTDDVAVVTINGTQYLGD